ncbi:MAG TPA: cytochrome c oxidase subunit 4, partial [Pseudonocardiaceae bacterium]|nr:cytochrome c oxidase subunit 4 [Pseudonocardiaceae bacterium]
MKVEGRIFLYISAFSFIMAVVYGVWSKLGSTDHTIEPVGLIALILTGGLALIVGTFFEFVARRLERPRPEDNPAAEVSDGAGEVGFFSPGSYWPIGMAGAATVIGLGLAFFQIWLAIVGVVLVLF